MSFIFSSCRLTRGDRLYTGSIMVKDHPNAEIYVDGKRIGTWTAIGLFPRNRPLTIEVREDGCETKTQSFGRRLVKGDFIVASAGGILGGFLLGSGWAFPSWTLEPDYMHNPSILKTTSSSFAFFVDYSGCKDKDELDSEN